MTVERGLIVSICLILFTALAITINCMESKDNETNTKGYETEIKEGTVRGETETDSGHGVGTWGQAPRTPTDRVKPNRSMGEGKAQRVPSVLPSYEREHGVLPNRLLPFMEQRQKNLQARIPC